MSAGPPDPSPNPQPEADPSRAASIPLEPEPALESPSATPPETPPAPETPVEVVTGEAFPGAEAPAAPGTPPGNAPPPQSAPEPASAGFGGAVRVIALLTLVSRFAGLIRESVSFKVFGASPVWSAFNVAFVAPNVFRRLFGEGALTAAFIPTYAALLKESPDRAGRLATLTMAALLAASGVVVVVGEILLWLALGAIGPDGAGRDAVVFTMVMLPYMPLICATAILGGMLQCHGKFVAPAAAPILFNGCMIAGATVWAWVIGAGTFASAMAVAFSVTVSGFVQLGWCLWSLRGVVSWRSGFAEVKDSFRDMLRRFLPVTISSGTMQLSVVADTLIAGYAVTFGDRLPWGTPYPVDASGGAILAYASRLYQFPLGVFGIAVATAVFPALARAHGQAGEFIRTLRHGVRLSLFIGLPATVGLVVVGHNLCSVVFSSEAGRAADVLRVAQVLAGYSVAVWAYSLTHVLNKAFYAAGDTKTPMRVSLATIACNIAVNLVLIWPLKEAGLAWATMITATAQCFVLGVLASKRFAPEEGLFDAETKRAVALTLLASVIMGAVLLFSSAVWPLGEGASWAARALALARDTLVGIGVFGALALILRRQEVRWLLERNAGGAGGDFG